MMAGVAHLDSFNQRMDYTKMRNMNGHVFNAADTKVKPIMHHVPEFVESLPAGGCNGCGDPQYDAPETARCKECSKKNEPQEYFAPEWAAPLRGDRSLVLLEEDASWDNQMKAAEMAYKEAEDSLQRIEKVMNDASTL